MGVAEVCCVLRVAWGVFGAGLDWLGVPFMLAADGGVFFDAAVPGETGDGVSEDDPESLDDEAADKVGSGGFAHVNTYREKELVREGGIKKDLFETFGQNVEWKEMPAGDVFECEKYKDEGRNFEDPKGKHSHCVGGEELEHRGHYN